MPHAALLGPSDLLDACAPVSTDALRVSRVDGPASADALAATGADAIVAFSPSAGERTAIEETALPALLWWPGDPETPADARGSLRTIAGASTTASGVWRNVGLPVADSLFSTDPPAPAGTTAVSASWLGPSSPRREKYLRAVEHAVPILDDDDALVAVNLHDRPAPAWEQRAVVALARGRLLVSEPLAPSRGLEPGIDHIEAPLFEGIQLAVENALRAPDAFLRVRLRGRRKAELFRASRVVARLVGDLLLELEAGAR